jgi:hypothetical protein
MNASVSSFHGSRFGPQAAGIFFIVHFSFFIFGCAYSFTGSSVPPHLKSIAIPLFDDQSGSGEPGMREEFTNKLIDRFTRDNSLEIADRKEADSILECVILPFRDEVAVVEKGETVSKRRVTITIKATYQDMKLRKKVWEKNFSNWGAYDLGAGPAERKTAITAAIDKLTEDLLLETVSGW